MRRSRLLATLAAATLLVVSCGPQVLESRQPSRVAVPMLEGESCLLALQAVGARFVRSEDFREKNGCGIGTAVVLDRTVTRYEPPARLDCRMALALMDFDRTAIQPLADEILGQRVETIHQYSAYVCRRNTGNRSVLSEHAYGLALDIGGFELEDGTIVNVETDWRDGSPAGDFLDEVSQAMCESFSVVLGPGHDRAHRNHFHIDLGPWGLCKP